MFTRGFSHATTGGNISSGGQVRTMDTTLLDDIRKSVYADGLDTAVERYRATLASWPGEPTGIWLRVSTGRQDEAGQLPDVLMDCESQGLCPVKFYIVHDKSAYKGEQQAKLDEMLHDVREGTITVVAMWDIDRLDRRGGTSTVDDVRHVIDAGGRVRAKRQGDVGLTTMGDRVGLFLSGEQAREYSEKISEAVSRTNREIKALKRNMAGGGYPWGYRITGDRDKRRNKSIAPVMEAPYARMVDGQMKHYAVDIFERCIAGDSCMTIARWLNSEHVPTRFGKPWTEGAVYGILTNMSYAGRRQDEGIGPDGKPHRELRQTVMTCPAVISMGIFNDARDALKSPGRKRGPGAANQLPNRSLLAKLRCARCGGPMNRTRGGRKNQRAAYYYRCRGNDHERRGCGNMIYLPALDLIVTTRIFMTSNDPHEEREWVPGKDWSANLAEIEQELAELPRKFRPGSAEFRARQDELVAQYEDYDNRPATRGGWKHHKVLNPDGSVMTEGEFFNGLDTDGQREYLMTRDIRAEFVANPQDEPSATRGARIIIDGVDHGIFPYPPPKEFR
jgi:DNA invertase Pin-like site-specific DNA recombinase